MTRVLVTGGRNYRPSVNPGSDERLRSVFRRITDKYGAANLTLICGMAVGADSMAWQAANEMAWKNIEEYRPDWEKHGRAAGCIRNEDMLVIGRPDMCIAFPGGNGTADMTSRCKRAGVPVYRFG